MEQGGSMAFKKPRGKCPYCGATFSVSKEGKLRKHNTSSGKTCNGSGQRKA
jgi:hypothetical protein